MGQEIDLVSIDDAQRTEFAARLRAETLRLKKLFDTRAFAYHETPTVGLEIEACLVDASGTPLAENDAFLDAASDPLLVHELARFNFEANVAPCTFRNLCFTQLEQRITDVWRRAQEAAATLDATPLMIGILPTLTSAHLNLDAMSRSNRYRALNEQLFVLRREKPLSIDIRGRQHLRMTLCDVMLEAAATSIQVHLSVNQEDARRVYNAAQVLAAPLVALAANAPFLYGKDLWEETRIEVFEQAVKVASFRDKRGVDIGRVTMGTGYSRHGFLELFLQNLDAYPPMLPIL
ncbi:MAG: glutamate--cysteine ligase, partial [Gammaproteobacteria bacterium]|nr:glutamate--cysteine ligase [Gammaproteobacteria bacterium]